MAPEHVEVVIAPRSFDRGAGPVIGPIVVRHASPGATAKDFPAPGWVDFPVVVLGWWLAELAELAALASGAATGATCRFMDGPFELRLTDVGDTLWRVRCVERHVETDATVAEFLVPGRALLDTVGAAARAALAECERRGWADADAEALRHALEPTGTPPP